MPATLFLVLSIRHYLLSVKDFDVVTEVFLRPTSEIPFPAVVVASRELPDPMAWTKGSGYIVPAEDLPEEGKLKILRKSTQRIAVLIYFITCILFIQNKTET